jgi:hypothetical protein
MDMDGYFRNKFIEWKKEIYAHWRLILISLILIFISLIILYYAGNYVTYKANVAVVRDLVLDYLGPYDLNFLYVWVCMLILFVYFTYPLFFKVKQLHIAIAQFSLVMTTRSIFMIFTHLQTPLDAIRSPLPGILNNLRFVNDQFFSGHVAFSFLGYLMFKDSKLRYFFLIGCRRMVDEEIKTLIFIYYQALFISFCLKKHLIPFNVPITVVRQNSG